ncbi:Pal1 family protein [Aspergillus glaucus CBS 516.65]|uniref:Pal1 cell morphology protein n=1 Tax=Aspergillus glaucus CBS 516.65 TaxID=1160497 RepID=A0A1L9V7X0_ASPGL|nr:hypothetical protein ASPGLDRAFT_896934 [Aspergillus glaucus CBS 516.65]OJJ80016.1 hypothetical protein ASPGLDRAFT_896934 [Aspergillus glaucus CBS 516.65]
MSAPQQPLPYAYPGGVTPGPSDGQNSPQLPVNLASNNPFRNRALSPAVNSAPRPERPTSTNPFLDDSDAISPQSAPGASMMSPPMQPLQQPLQPVKPVQPVPQEVMGNTSDLFASLSLNQAPQSNGHRPPPPRPDDRLKQRPTTSRRPKDHPSRREKDPLDIFADPPALTKSNTTHGGRERERRPRRNSESSVMERPKAMDPEEERRRRERRRRDREARHRDGKPRSKKANYHMDIIDKLDVTSIYGTGMFHHDGPFDACNPNRNRKGVRTAPMQAFPQDSTNMALGGAGPVNKNIDLDLFHGRATEGWNDYASTGTAPDTVGRSAEGVSFDPKSKLEPVHGPTSLGLGTSTFLDGAPASRNAMQRRASENEQGVAPGGGGLQRKKSLAQRIRGINRAPSGRVVSPDSSYPGPAGLSGQPPRVPERKPSIQDYDEEWDKKGAKINSAEDSRPVPEAGRARSSSSPKQSTFSNERSNSGFDESKPNNGSGGLLNRMKSLRRPRPERRVSDD